MREHDLPVPDQGRKALHSERDDIFPDLHGLDLKGRLRAAFLTDRGLGSLFFVDGPTRGAHQDRQPEMAGR